MSYTDYSYRGTYEVVEDGSRRPNVEQLPKFASLVPGDSYDRPTSPSTYGAPPGPPSTYSTSPRHSPVNQQLYEPNLQMHQRKLPNYMAPEDVRRMAYDDANGNGYGHGHGRPTDRDFMRYHHDDAQTSDAARREAESHREQQQQHQQQQHQHQHQHQQHQQQQQQNQQQNHIARDPLPYLPHSMPVVSGFAPQGGPPSIQPPQTQGQPPRQRTSIACRYCRKRKIRCSGYANSPGGRCVNCTRMNQECIFQPVSSTGTSAAFVHISALSGPIPASVPIYGAYGEQLSRHQSNSPPAAAFNAPLSGAPSTGPISVDATAPPTPPGAAYSEHRASAPQRKSMPPLVAPSDPRLMREPNMALPLPDLRGWSQGSDSPTSKRSQSPSEMYPGQRRDDAPSLGPSYPMKLSHLLDNSVDRGMLDRLARGRP